MTTQPMTHYAMEQAIEQDPKPSFPFNMIEKMMPAFPMMAVMGWMMVLIALGVGYFRLAPAQAAFFADAKAIREGAQAGTAFVNANVASHVMEAWVPSFKFFGLGLMLMAIVMALGTIAKRLRTMGKVISSHMSDDLRPATPPIPKRVRIFQLSAMMGIMLMLAAMVIGFVLANNLVPAYWNNAIAATLNPAEAGSTLLTQAGTVKSFHFWLNPLRMVGMAFLFTSITVALTVIINTLRLQAKVLVDFYRQASALS